MFSSPIQKVLSRRQQNGIQPTGFKLKNIWQLCIVVWTMMLSPVQGAAGALFIRRLSQASSTQSETRTRSSTQPATAKERLEKASGAKVSVSWKNGQIREQHFSGRWAFQQPSCPQSNHQAKEREGNNMSPSHRRNKSMHTKGSAKRETGSKKSTPRHTCTSTRTRRPSWYTDSITFTPRHAPPMKDKHGNITEEYKAWEEEHLEDWEEKQVKHFLAPQKAKNSWSSKSWYMNRPRSLSEADEEFNRKVRPHKPIQQETLSRYANSGGVFTCT